MNSNQEKYVYKNSHRNFTQSDIDYIYDLSKYIAEIIIDEKREGVTNFFNRMDNNQKSFFTIEEFKDILKEELQISLEENEDDIENIKLFLDFITDDQNVIRVKKIIHIITGYSKRDLPENINNNEKNISINKNKINLDSSKGKIEERVEGEEEKEELNKEDEGMNFYNGNFGKESNLKQQNYYANHEKIISDFAHYLNRNKIRFSSIFQGIDLNFIINGQTISGGVLKLGFQYANYPLSEENFLILMTHYDPINKAQVPVEKLINEISIYEPSYFKQKFQKYNPNSTFRLEQNNNYDYLLNSVINSSKNRKEIINGLAKIDKYLNDNNITIELFMNKKFYPEREKNEDINDIKKTIIVTQDDFIQKLTDKNSLYVIRNLEEKEVEAIYRIIPRENNRELTLSEIINYLSSSQKKESDVLNINADDFLEHKIQQEISEMFDKYDEDKDEVISNEDFIKCLRTLNHNITAFEVDHILLNISTSANRSLNYQSKIIKKDFCKIMYDYYKKKFFIKKEEENYIINLFKEADVDKKGFLSIEQIKYIIKYKLKSDIKDEDLVEFLEKLDLKGYNEIDIKEFVSILDILNRQYNYNGENDNDKRKIIDVNLNLNMYKNIKPKHFMTLYDDLPLTFRPSFIKEEQKNNNLFPSRSLRPSTIKKVYYQDIRPIGDFPIIYKNPEEDEIIDDEYKYLKEINTDINCKILFNNYATGVPSPEESLYKDNNSKFKIVGRLLKIALFNKSFKKFIGNSISIDCIYKKEYQDRWYFENSEKYNNNIMIRYDEGNKEEINVIFEFVLVIQRLVENNNYTIEISCGWCEEPLKSLNIKSEKILKIYGGSPFNNDPISNLDIRTKRTGFIPNCLSLTDSKVESKLTITIKPFKEFNSDEKKYINFLPSFIIFHGSALHILYIYRKIIGESILNHKDYGLKPIQDEFILINKFCKIADIPDAFRIMVETWNEVIIEKASKEKNKEEFFKINFEKYVKRINSVLYAEKFNFDLSDPTRLPRGDIKLMQDRHILLNSILRYDEKDKKYNLRFKQPDHYSFKPFTMDEVSENNNFSTLGKLDELIHYINK